MEKRTNPSCRRGLRPIIGRCPAGHRSELFAFLVPLAVAVSIAIGCGSGSDLPLAPVAGTVSYQGRPLEHGEVVFTPESGTAGPQSVGRIEGDGSYRVRTAGRDGAPLGRHVVTVHCRRQPTPEEIQNLVITESLIPQVYSQQDQSPLRFEVRDGTNEYKIKLQ